VESFLITFPAVVLAELGDKTQLVVVYLAARYRQPWAILGGLLVAAVASAGLAVAGGALLDRLLPDGLLDAVVVVVFIAFGAWMLIAGAEHEIDSARVETGARGAFATTLWLLLVLEMGDKTQLAVLALAAGLAGPFWVLAGAAAGLTVANLPALWLGHRYASRVPTALLHRIGGTLFIAIGLGMALLLLGPAPSAP